MKRIGWIGDLYESESEGRKLHIFVSCSPHRAITLEYEGDHDSSIELSEGDLRQLCEERLRVNREKQAMDAAEDRDTEERIGEYEGKGTAGSGL